MSELALKGVVSKTQNALFGNTVRITDPKIAKWGNKMLAFRLRNRKDFEFAIGDDIEVIFRKR